MTSPTEPSRRTTISSTTSPVHAAPPRVVGVVGLDLAQQPRRLDAAAGPEGPAAGAAARAVADARAEAFAVARALAGAGAAAGTGALAVCLRRGRPQSTPSRSRVSAAAATTGATRTRRRQRLGRALDRRAAAATGGVTGVGLRRLLAPRGRDDTGFGVTAGPDRRGRSGPCVRPCGAGSGLRRPPPPPPPPGPGVMRKTSRAGSWRGASTRRGLGAPAVQPRAAMASDAPWTMDDAKAGRPAPAFAEARVAAAS